MKKTKVLFFLVLSLALVVLGGAVYYRITIDELNLITGILFLLAICTLIFLSSETAVILIKSSKNTKKNIRLLLVTTIVLLFGLEFSLRFGLNKYSTYRERNGSKNYSSIYSGGHPSWFHIRGKNQDLIIVKPEYTQIRKINSLGLAEREIEVEKEPNEYRIIALGDSFTEGQGTSYNSTWVKVLERKLIDRSLNKKVTTINAGIAGSDPYYEYVLLKEKLQPFKPDLVIVAINRSDVYDIIIRGGMERFLVDGSTVFSRKAPSWEWAYAISYIFRPIIHDIFKKNFFFLKKDDLESEAQKAFEKIKLVIDEFGMLSKKDGFELLFVAHPFEREVKIETYISGFGGLISDLKNEQSINFVDLLEYYKVNKIITKDNVSNFYWSIDLHHNTKGYEAMGNAITNKIIELKLIKVENYK